MPQKIYVISFFRVDGKREFASVIPVLKIWRIFKTYFHISAAFSENISSYNLVTAHFNVYFEKSYFFYPGISSKNVYFMEDYLLSLDVILYTKNCIKCFFLFLYDPKLVVI